MDKVLRRIIWAVLFGFCSSSLSACVVLLPFIEYEPAQVKKTGCFGTAGVCTQCPQSPIVHMGTKLASPGVSQASSPVFSPASSTEVVAESKSKAVLKPQIKKVVRKRPKRPTIQLKIARLVSQLEDDDAAVRTNAATDLGLIGPRAIASLPSLTRAAKYDESKWVRRAAVKSLAKISSNSEVVRTLTGALNDRNKWVAHSAAGALRRIKTQEDIPLVYGSPT